MVCIQNRGSNKTTHNLIILFTVCGKHFSGFIEALDSEGILCTLALKKVLRQPITTRVFVVGHPTKYYPRRTGLNFVERTDHVAFPCGVVTTLNVFFSKMRKGIKKRKNL